MTTNMRIFLSLLYKVNSNDFDDLIALKEEVFRQYNLPYKTMQSIWLKASRLGHGDMHKILGWIKELVEIL